MHSVAIHPPQIFGNRPRPPGFAQHRVSAKESKFAALAHAFARGGGIASGDEVVQQMRRHIAQPMSALARQIVRRELLSFGWRGETLLPMFQFDPIDMSLRPGVLESVISLRGTLDDWALVCWFGQPHAALHGETPVDRLARDSAAVVRAARLSQLQFELQTGEQEVRPLGMGRSDTRS